MLFKDTGKGVGSADKDTSALGWECSHAFKRRSIGGVGFGMRRGVALKGTRSIGFNHRTSDDAMRLGGMLATFRAFMYRATLHCFFRKSLHVLVVGMISTDRR